ncbi:hypothetical protein SAMN05421505_10983 [Sinosporangium album]|uniref:DUF4157 domain-containing protein n=1 Tax=Sinosporangium album TaxID=504805 RepID=A0A1G7Y4M9_9ACTN|nr:hypothetical protein [Sinosporangium album]SDG90940.1 hypothetical protein SAMN05421505_10983 [Sinosporangium album]
METWPKMRRVLNYVNLSTPLGLAVSVVGGARRLPGPDGLVLAVGYRFPFPIAGAFTVGNVVLTKHDTAYLAQGNLLKHEARHATQWAACLGLPMLPLYVLSLGVSYAVCGDLASWNPFERLAVLEDGFYQRRSPRWARKSDSAADS